MHRRAKIFSIGDTIQYYLSQPRSTVKHVGTAPHQVAGQADHFALVSREGPPETHVPIKTDHYTLVLCLRGSGATTIGTVGFPFQQGSLYVVLPQYVHSYQQASDDLLLYSVLFKKEFLDEIALKEGVLEQLLECETGFMPLLNPPSPDFMAMKGLFELMNLQYRKEDAFSLPIIRLQLLQLLYEIQRVYIKEAAVPARSLSRSHQLVHEYHKLVEEQYQHLRTVQEYAGLLHVSPKYLSELIKSETGETALHVIHRRMYREAQYLLQYSGLSIKEIADRLNFDTPSHFSRFFKHFAGHNPSEALRPENRFFYPENWN
jgi:AraC-like DNA-binding protein